MCELSDSLAAWIGEIGLQRATLVGNSFGCQIIADLAVRHPERVERTVLRGPTMDPRRPAKLLTGLDRMLWGCRMPFNVIRLRILDPFRPGNGYLRLRVPRGRVRKEPSVKVFERCRCSTNVASEDLKEDIGWVCR